MKAYLDNLDWKSFFWIFFQKNFKKVYFLDQNKKSSFEKEIIEAESLAILNEEYFKILDLIDSNISFADISNSYNADVVSSESVSYNNFSVDELDVIKDELFQTNNTNNVFLDNEINNINPHDIK